MTSAQALLDAARAVLVGITPQAVRQIMRAPVFVVSAPRAGSTLLFETLAKRDGIWTIGGESHGVYHAFPHLRAENDRLDSGSLHRRHATAETVELMPACFLALLKDHRGRSFMSLPPRSRPLAVTFLEKTPRNALNIPFLLSVFPEARFIYLYRDPNENIASLIEAWQVGLKTGRFVTFRDLPGWDRTAWCFLLPPGWRGMVNRSIAEIATFQWAASNNAIVSNLRSLPPERFRSLSYKELITDPAAVLERMCRFAGVPAGHAAAVPLPLSRTSLSPPHSDKWRAHEQSIAACEPLIAPAWRSIQAFVANLN